MFCAFIISFPPLPGCYILPILPSPLDCYKLAPRCLRSKFQNKADVLFEGEASFMCIEARESSFTFKC